MVVRWRLWVPVLLGVIWLGGSYFLLMRHGAGDLILSHDAGKAAVDGSLEVGAADASVLDAVVGAPVLRARVVMHSGEKLQAWIDIEVEGESTEARSHCRNLATAQASRLASIAGVRGEVARSCSLDSLPPIPEGVDGAFGLWQDLGEEGASPSPGIIARLQEISVSKDEPACLKMLEIVRRRRVAARLEAAQERRRFLETEFNKQQGLAIAACKRDVESEECARLRGVVGLLKSRIKAPVEPAADLLSPDPGLACRAL